MVKFLHNKTQQKKWTGTMSFAERFKKLRGLETQKVFAEKLGITPQAVLNYEKHGRVPKGRYLTNICQKLGVREQWLLTGEGPIYSKEDGLSASIGMSGYPSDQQEEGMSDSRRDKSLTYQQRIENNAKKTHTPRKTTDMSENLGQREVGYAEKVMELQERLLASQERFLSLSEQITDLRLQLQARDIRIRELERENAELREANKGATHYGYGMAGA